MCTAQKTVLVVLSQPVQKTELTIRVQESGRHVIIVLKTLVNIAEFVHVPRFNKGYDRCVVHRANVDIVKALRYKLHNKKDVAA